MAGPRRRRLLTFIIVGGGPTGVEFAGSLAELARGAFLPDNRGLDVKDMQDDLVVFALANPIPEVQPEDLEGVARVVATGRSDYPNQINNSLGFPGTFRGALDVQATEINEAMTPRRRAGDGGSGKRRRVAGRVHRFEHV